jgi:hypothetical protein
MAAAPTAVHSARHETDEYTGVCHLARGEEDTSTLREVGGRSSINRAASSHSHPQWGEEICGSREYAACTTRSRGRAAAGAVTIDLLLIIAITVVIGGDEEAALSRA